MRRSFRRRRYNPLALEHLPGQAERDEELGRDEFYVYVIKCDLGYYIGHTWNVGARLAQHRAGHSRAGREAKGEIELVWTSPRHRTRLAAAKMEQQLKQSWYAGTPLFRRVCLGEAE